MHSWLTCLFLLPLVPPILLWTVIQHGGLRCPSSLLLHSEKQLGIASSILYKSYINSLYRNTVTAIRLVHSANPNCTGIYTTVNLNNKKEFILHNKLTWISSFTSICQCLFDWHCYLLCFLLDQWGKWLLPLRNVLLAGYYGITADNGICLLLDTLLEEKVTVLLRENGRQKRLQSEKKMEAFKIIHLSESMQRSHKLSSQRSYRVVKIHADYCNL